MGERRHVTRLGGVSCVRACSAIYAALFRDGVLGFARASPYSVGLRILRGMPAPTTPLRTADGLRQLAAALGDRAAPSLRARLRGVPLRNAEPCLQGLATELGVPFENITRDTLVHRIVMALCPLAAPGAQADIKYHVWRLLCKLRDARAETAEAVAAAARDIVESSNLRRAAAAYCLDVTVEVIARRHCSAAEKARILATGVVSVTWEKTLWLACREWRLLACAFLCSTRCWLPFWTLAVTSEQAGSVCCNKCFCLLVRT